VTCGRIISDDNSYFMVPFLCNFGQCIYLMAELGGNYRGFHGTLVPMDKIEIRELTVVG